MAVLSWTEGWVGVAPDSGEDWIHDPEMFHEDDELVYLFRTSRGQMSCYSKALAIKMLSTVHGIKYEKAMATYIQWKLVHGASFLSEQAAANEKARHTAIARAEECAKPHIPRCQQFDAYWRLRIAALALSYLTNKPVDTSRDPRNSACWVLHHNIDYLVGLYALRFDLAPPPEVPTWWAAASKHFSVCTYDWNDFHIELLSEEAEKLHYQRRSGCAPIFMEKTPAEHRAEAEVNDAYQEQQYCEQLQADPNYQEDVQNQLIADSVYDSLSSEGFWVSDDEYWCGLPSVTSAKTHRSRSSSASRSEVEITEKMLSEAGLRRLAALKLWRTEQAREKNLPAYVVFHDPTLVTIAERVPKSFAEMASIAGMSATKLKAYGQMILGVLDTCP